ncbi:MAG: spore coat protein [Syntrophomonadaceae bacterium]|jgi:spore coat protein CotF
MANLIGQFFNDITDQSLDQTLSLSAMATAAAGAQLYLSATLASTTPELRAVLAGFVAQKTAEHEAITNYIMNRGWMNPYDDPTKQLETCYQESQSVLSQN